MFIRAFLFWTTPLRGCCTCLLFLKKDISEHIITEYNRGFGSKLCHRSKRNHRNGDRARSIFFVPGSFIRDVNLHKSPAIRPAVRRQNPTDRFARGAINGIGPTRWIHSGWVVERRDWTKRRLNRNRAGSIRGPALIEPRYDETTNRGSVE